MREFFSQFGKVIDSTVMLDRETGRSKGFGFVSFEDTNVEPFLGFGKLEIDGRLYNEVRSNWFPWTMPFNLTGHPAITIPCGFGRDGLPIGLQLVGRLRQESDLLAAASVFETARNLVSRWPDLEVQ